MLGGLLNQEVTIEPFSSNDGYGKPTYGTAVDYKARVELKEKRRMMPNGEIVVTNGVVILSKDATVDTDDRLTYDSTKYRVFSVNKAVGGSGRLHHQTVEIMLWP